MRRFPNPQIILLTAAGFCLRFFRLGVHGFWLDEIVTVRDAAHRLGEIPSVLASYPPIWAYVTHAALGIFGHSDFGLRAPAAVFGTLTVPVMYRVAKRFFGKRAGRWAGILMAVSVFDVLYSQEVRMYALVALEALVSMYFWNQAVETRARRDWLAYAVPTLAGLYTHNWFPFLVLAQGVWWTGEMARRRSVDKEGMAVYLAILLFYAPWIPMLERQLALPVYAHLRAPGWIEIRETFYAYAGARVPSGDSSVELAYEARQLLLLISSGFLAWGILRPGNDRRRAIRIFIVGLLAPVSLAFLISVFVRPVYLPGRYTILGLPAYLLIAARGIQGVPARWSWAAGLLAGVWVAASVCCLGRYYWFYEKSPWKETCRWIAAQSPEPETLHLALEAKYADYFVEYYLAARRVDEAASLADPSARTLFLVTEEGTPRRQSALDAAWRPTAIARFGRLTVYKIQR